RPGAPRPGRAARGLPGGPTTARDRWDASTAPLRRAYSGRKPSPGTPAAARSGAPADARSPGPRAARTRPTRQASATRSCRPSEHPAAHVGAQRRVERRVGEDAHVIGAARRAAGAPAREERADRLAIRTRRRRAVGQDEPSRLGILEL